MWWAWGIPLVVGQGWETKDVCGAACLSVHAVSLARLSLVVWVGAGFVQCCSSLGLPLPAGAVGTLGPEGCDPLCRAAMQSTGWGFSAANL